jgi:hypothetical protein
LARGDCSSPNKALKTAGQNNFKSNMENKKHCHCNAFFVLFSAMIRHFFAKEKDKDSLSFFYN